MIPIKKNNVIVIHENNAINDIIDMDNEFYFLENIYP